MPKKKKKVGRPSGRTPTVVSKILGLAEKGKTEKQIAEIIGVHEVTLHRWKRADIEFCMALNERKQEADQMVEATLLRRALGYSHPAEKISFDKEGNERRAQYVEHYPPDPTSMIFWLKNRQPKKWRDKREVAGSEDGEPIKVVIERYTDE